MAPLALGAIWLGGVAFLILLVALAVLGLREWVLLVSPAWRDPASPMRSVGSLSGLAALVGLLGALVAVFGLPPLSALAAIAGLTAATALVARLRGHPHCWLLAAGLAYMAIPVLALWWLRQVPDDGLWLVLWLFLVVWATDIGGYAVGRKVGGPRLAPRISPGKTWSGLAGAMAAAALVSAVAGLLLGAAQPAVLALLAAVLAVVAQIGDLTESAVKRKFGAKDSGALIPGHGGLLDRIDGLLAAAPALALILALTGGQAAWG